MAKYVRMQCSSDPSYGCAPAARDLGSYVERGVVFLDKPSGPTSRRAADVVRELLGASKAGHGGTLDPRVSGVLPVLLGKSTKAAGLLLGGDKTYEGVMELHGDVAAGELEHVRRGFCGVIDQMPPRRSRVKRQMRQRVIYDLRMTRRSGRRVEFAVRCQGGTYIRKLVHDLGQGLGCGAHMVSLRRTHASAFSLDDCVTLEEIRRAAGQIAAGRGEAARSVVRPVEAVVGRLLPQVVIHDGAVHSVSTGYPLAVPGVCELDDLERQDQLAIMTLKGELVGIGRALLNTREILAATAGLAATTSSVLISSDAYPKWRSKKG